MKQELKENYWKQWKTEQTEQEEHGTERRS